MTMTIVVKVMKLSLKSKENQDTNKAKSCSKKWYMYIVLGIQNRYSINLFYS